MTILQHLDNVLWWLRYRLVPRHQHHIVRTGLKPGYCDKDHRMLHAVMALVVEFVEWECGGAEKLSEWSRDLRANPDRHVPEVTNRQADVQDEFVAVYRWWTEGKPKDEAREKELLDLLYGNKPLKTEVQNGLGYLVFEERTAPEEVLYRELRALEVKIEFEEQSMLHRVIDVRPGMWT